VIAQVLRRHDRQTRAAITAWLRQHDIARGRTPEDADTRSGRCWQPRLQPCWGSKRSHVDFTDRQRADAELNRIYAKVLALNAQDTVFLERFKAAQRAWLVFRDAQIAARYPSPDDYGSVLPMCQSVEYEQLTLDRIKQLKAWVGGVEEGDVCAGSYPMSGR